MELLFPLILLVPLLLITFRSRKQQRTFAELQSRITPGQRVMTTAGLHGTITQVDGDTVLLEVADGLELRWAKAGIGQIVEADDAPEAVDLTDAEPSAEAADQGAAASPQAGVQDADDKVDTVTAPRDHRRDEV
jgi:preprotein translocase subunit YajC